MSERIRLEVEGEARGAQKAAGETVGVATYWTPERIIRALRADARRRGRPPTLHEWGHAVRGKRPTSKTVVRRFSSWNAALKQSCLPTRTTPLPRTHCRNGHDLASQDGPCAMCRAASRRHYQARRRRHLLLAGRCTSCAGDRDEAGYFTCSRCRARDREKARRRRLATAT